MSTAPLPTAAATDGVPGTPRSNQQRPGPSVAPGFDDHQPPTSSPRAPGARSSLRRPGRAIALAAIALLASAPFLLPHHRNPLPAFYQEWWAMLLGTLAVLAACWRALPARVALPPAAWPPLALALLIAVQWATGSALPALAGFAIGTLLWAAALIVVAMQMIDDDARRVATSGDNAVGAETGSEPAADPAVALALAWGLLAGALLGAAAGIAQWAGLPPIEDLLAPRVGERVVGNLMQANHLATQLTLGIAGAVWLRGRARLSPAVTLACLAPLVAVAVATGSRTFWAMLLVLLLGVLLLARQDRPASVTDSAEGAVGTEGTDEIVRRASARMVLARVRAALLVTLLLALAAKATLLAIPGPAGEDGRRLLASPQSDALRVRLLQTSAAIWQQAPLTGAGWGRFTAASFAAGDGLAPTTQGEHAHNVLAQIAAETGIAGLLIVALLLFQIGRAVPRAAAGGAALLGALLLLPLGVHSLLEYPLWYAFFLGPAALAVALLCAGAPSPAASAGASATRRTGVARPLLAALACAALLALALLRHDYAAVERTLRWPLTDPGETPLRWEEVMPRLTALRRESAFAPWIDFALARAVPASGEDPRAALAMVDLAMKSFPAPELAIKRVLLLARSGDAAAALSGYLTLQRGFPALAAEHANLLAAMAAQYPEIAALHSAAATAD